MNTPGQGTALTIDNIITITVLVAACRRRARHRRTHHSWMGWTGTLIAIPLALAIAITAALLCQPTPHRVGRLMSIISSTHPTRDWTETIHRDGTLGSVDTDDTDLRHQQTSLSFIDWDHIVTQLGASLAPLLRPDAEHLLPDTHLRAHLVDTLLHAGVHPHEIHLDAPHPTHATRARVELRLDLDTGLSTTITITHPTSNPRTRSRTTGWFTALHRAVHHPAHEHITLSLLTHSDITHLTGQFTRAHLDWPTPGRTLRLDADQVTTIAGVHAGRAWPDWCRPHAWAPIGRPATSCWCSRPTPSPIRAPHLTPNPACGEPLVIPSTNPDTGNPDTGNPDTGNPDTGNPDTGNPDTGNPDTGNPDTGRLGAPGRRMLAPAGPTASPTTATPADMQTGIRTRSSTTTGWTDPDWWTMPASPQLVLLDFDVPITRLLPAPVNRDLANRLKHVALHHTMRLSPSLTGTSDHLALVRAAADTHQRRILRAVEQAASTGEIHAASHATPAPGAGELLAWLHARDIAVHVVTNNTPTAVKVFLERHGWTELVCGIHGRQPEHPELMKPHPWMLQQALAHHRHHQAVMIGDSTSDMHAARTIGIPGIGITGTHPDRQVGQKLQDAGAHLLVSTLADLLSNPAH